MQTTHPDGSLTTAGREFLRLDILRLAVDLEGDYVGTEIHR